MLKFLKFLAIWEFIFHVPNPSAFRNTQTTRLDMFNDDPTYHENWSKEF